MRIPQIILVLLASTSLLAACTSDVEVECEHGEQECLGSDSLRTCVDGAWQEATPCDEMAVCMFHDDMGMEMCMEDAHMDDSGMHSDSGMTGM